MWIENIATFDIHNIGKGTPPRCEALGSEKLPSFLSLDLGGVIDIII